MVWSTATAAFFVSALLAAQVCALLWPRRAMPGARALLLCMASAATWAVAAGVEAAAVDTATKILLSKISYLGIAPLPVCYLVFALQFARPDRPLPRSALVALSIVPALTIGAAFTNEWHGLLWPGFEPDTARNLLIYGHGPAFYAFVAYAYLLVVVAAAVLSATAIRGARFYGAQVVVVIAASAGPVFFNLLYVMRQSPVPGLDLAPMVFSVSGLLLTLALYRLGLFRLVPLAHHLVVEHLDDGVAVVDAEGQLVDHNRRAVALAGGIEGARELAARMAPEGGATGEAPAERILRVGDRDLEVRASVIRAPAGPRMGAVLLWRDVTERLRDARELAEARRALAERVNELEETLARVTRLETLLPICAYCKKVRDDRDYWQEVDAYLSQRTGARLTHGVCPQCAERLLSEMPASTKRSP